MMKRIDGIIDWFEKNRPDAVSELHFQSPYQLLVAVMLSAQCTDKRVNMTTPALFERFPSAKELAAASPEEVFTYIKSISYPNSKANHLVEMARQLMERFEGNVPSEIEELESLQGVGRKTANVVASVVYHKNVIAVDTHVFRIAHRLGLSTGKTPLAVELDLNKCFPEPLRAKAHHWLILHGRYVCTARKPKCAECGLSPFCKDYSSNKSHE